MSHVTVRQRYTIEVMLDQGYKQIEVARAIGNAQFLSFVY